MALGLTGCNLNGVTFDTSALPSLNIEEVNCNNCNINLDKADDDRQTHYFIWERFVVQDGEYQGTFSTSGGWVKGYDGSYLSSEPYVYYEWGYGSQESTDKKYDNVRRRVDIDGDSGLFIEYNDNPTPDPILIERSSITEFYIVAGGNVERFERYTPMPIGNYQYNGKVVTKSFYDNTFSNGTVNAEVNFTDSMVVSIEFEGADIDSRFEDIKIDIENGTFGKGNRRPVGEGAISNVSGMFFGTEAKGLQGFVHHQTLEKTAVGMYLAERSDTPVIAEN